MAESFGVEGRGAFYEEVGAILRDVVQNHLLQVVAMLAMEPPVGADADALRDEKVKVFRATRSVGPGHRGAGPVRRLPGRGRRGRRLGRRDLRRHAPRDRLVALVRRALLRASRQATGQPRRWRRSSSFGSRPACSSRTRTRRCPHPNLIRFRLGASDGVTMTVQAKQPGPDLIAQPVDLSVDFASSWASVGRPTSGSSTTPSPAMPAGSPAMTRSSARGASCSPPSTIRGPCSTTRRAAGVRRRPTPCSARTTGTNPSSARST